MRDSEFRDARLVMLYDAAYRWARDDDFFLGMVGQTPVRVLDLGCGTGRLALGMAAAGHAVTGIDPARASLDAARTKPGAAEITWIEGTSADAPSAAFDVVVMTSHVAQFIVDDAEWERTLADLRRALVPGGRLVFDSRDPSARGWERWNPVDSRTRTTLPDGRVIPWWTEVTDVAEGRVTFLHHYDFPEGELLSSSTMRFRSEDEIRSSLYDNGFVVEEIYGGWDREPVGAGELLVIARRS
ncbi:class I SAM-dependent methyltransferase [Allokutzneria albata]|nr:class I SAM-dependent methyltransferase [Allokutzneria albata]